MLICSVSTLVFNANPLLRFDGYYIFSDLLEVPNLADKARLGLLNLLRTACLGLPPLNGHRLPSRSRWLFYVYAVAAFCYRTMLITAIALLLLQVFRKVGMQSIGRGLVLFVASTIIGAPLLKMVRYFARAGSLTQLKIPRFVASLVVSLAFVALILFLPIPYPIRVPIVVSAKGTGATQVYAPKTGALSEVYVQPGETVTPGTPLMRLVNHESTAKLAEIRSRLVHQQQRVNGLQRRAISDPTAVDTLPEEQAKLTDLENQWAEVEREDKRLIVMADQTGVIFAPTKDPQRQLGLDRVFDRACRGRYIEQGELLCCIADPDALAAQLVIPESSAGFVQVGQSVTVRLNAYPDSPLRATVSQKANQSDITTNEASSESSAMNASQPTCQALVVLPDTSIPIALGMTGVARIDAAPRTLAARLAHAVRRQLCFR